MPLVFRASGPLDAIQKNLGLLGDLPGTFIGTGFNLIARPDKQNNNPFFLELNATRRSWNSPISVGTSQTGGLPNPTSIFTASAICSASPIARRIPRFIWNLDCGSTCLPRERQIL